MVQLSSKRCRTQTAMAEWCLDGLPDWGTIWVGCARRFRSWRIPPRWSVGDWFEELQAQSIAAAWQALRDYDPRGRPAERVRAPADPVRRAGPLPARMGVCRALWLRSPC